MKKIEDLENSCAVMYKGTVYRLENTAIEGSLRRIKLISLHSREIVIVLLHFKSIILTSSLISKKCRIINQIDFSTFEVADKVHIKLPIHNAIQVKRWLLESKIVCLNLFYCFDEMYIGDVYCIF